NQRKIAITLFNQGKQDSFQYTEMLKQFRLVCHRKTTLLQMFLEILISTAYADGHLHSSELNILRDAASILGFSTPQFENLLSRCQTNANKSSRSTQSPKLDTNAAYAILGCSTSSSVKQIKTAYRRLISQHHPDKLVSKGLPEEMIKIATEKTGEIRAAYEHLMMERKK
ncbi:MAG: co-chaperone DjlA, partial [Gammaproteobacteria bacterium]|nr:co-chaperone DjlA [Gammaproteobacteria bacterium]